MASARQTDVDGVVPMQASRATGDDEAMPLPSDPQTVFLAGLFLLALLAACYAASAIVLPVVLAFVLKLLLQPLVRILERVHVPTAVGAIVAIVLFVGTLIAFIAALSGPAATWAQDLPEGVPRLESHLKFLSKPLQLLKSFLDQAEQVASAPEHGAIAVRGDLGLEGAVFSGTRAIADGLFTTVLVLYFLLISGDTFLRRFVEILPTFRDKRQAVEISQRIEGDISAYLLTITAMNVAVGLATAVAMYLCGLGDPLLWGATAFLLNFVPILGPMLGVVLFLLAGMLSFDNFWWALLPPALYFAIHLVEGETLTPLLLAQRFTLNPVVVILSLVFWFWMWGAPGAILSVPILAVMKIVCDRLRPLKAIGHFLEG